jgi:hypothetical protein
MPDYASSRGANFAMPGHVASYSPDDGPLMQPLASAGETRASANRQAMAKIAFMIVLRSDDVGGSSRLNDGRSVRPPVDGYRCARQPMETLDGRSPAFRSFWGAWGRSHAGPRTCARTRGFKPDRDRCSRRTTGRFRFKN